MNEKILLVDDEPDFLDVVGEFLREDEGYALSCARSAAEALEELKKNTYDLLLSDINMPGMKGFELLNEASRLYPALKTALITAYDVHDYLYLAKNYNIGNIITKTTPFNFTELALLVRNIVSGDIFGLERYLDAEFKSLRISHSRDIESVITAVIDAHRRKFRQALGEILINAVYYGARRERGDKKSLWKIDVALKPDEEVIVSWGTDAEKTAISVLDQKGRLTKREVLYWLERNTTKDEDGVTIGLLDEHGKGLFITRETIDRLIVNIQRGSRTEMILLNYLNDTYTGHRPLWIQEV
jgi:CheY-like chemotaxis protein